jgi:hypothetical protein
VAIWPWAAGAAIGGGVYLAAQQLLPSPGQAQQAEAAGVHVESSEHALAVAAPALLMSGAGIGAGLLRRADNSKLGLAMLASAGLITGITSTTVAKSDTEFGSTYLATLGINVAATGAGVWLGCAPQVSETFARRSGEVAASAAAGILAIEAGRWLWQQGIETRDGMAWKRQHD